MDNFALISTLKAYSDSKEWVFLYGNKSHQNILASQHEYSAGQLVLTADFDAEVKFTKAFSIDSIIYTGVLALGIKIDEAIGEADPVVVGLDETYYQKYLARLKDLMTLLTTHIAAIACDNQLEVTQCLFRIDINRFDTNIDFIAATVTFIQ